MPGAWTAIRSGVVVLAAMQVALLVGCGDTRQKNPETGGPAPVPKDYKTTEVGRRYVDNKIVVKAVDRSRLAEGAVSITIQNRTDEFLTDLAYEVTLYYRNTEQDPKRRAAMPYTPETTPKKRIDLDAKEETTLVVKPGVLSPRAADVFLRIRLEKPEPTRVRDAYMSDRVRVVAIDRDWFSNPPSVKFTVRNEWEGPLRVQFKVMLIKDGKVVSETDWRNAPGILTPGGQMVLEPDLTGMEVYNTYPALKVKRPRI